MSKILDWNNYIDKARTAVAEGCVLVENNGVLPLERYTKISVFGRMQLHYYKSGTGSGGMVNNSKVIGILDALVDCEDVEINEELVEIYKAWDSENPFDEGEGWGQEPWSQLEMELSDEVVVRASSKSDTALVIIARTAGEDKDAADIPGSYRLTELEEDMLRKVRDSFDKMVVVLNVGGAFDMCFVEKYTPDAVLYAWQGGMIGGLGTVDVLVGKCAPSGHLTDTLCYNLDDQPSKDFFGDKYHNIYGEDIFVGYRYYETFNKNAVRYPFGYGLSYTSFEIEDIAVAVNVNTRTIDYSVSVVNTGDFTGKEVIQLYVEAPQGKLGKPQLVLVDFKKSASLSAGLKEELKGSISFDRFASYDDSGVTGHRSAFVVEEGNYRLYVGENVRDINLVNEFVIDELIVIEQLSEALAPHEEFKRMKPRKTDSGYEIDWEAAPTATIDDEETRKNNLPKEIAQTENKNIRLEDVKTGRYTIEEFVAQMTDDDLTCIVRGEGMGSSRVTPGTASAFGGVSDGLYNVLGIPAVCCSDGPSGMRLDCGAKAFSLPNGTMLGCTFNPQLVEELYECLGLEMIYNKVDCLLGPGMNIHRNLLNGRNFEYYSEDPYLTGVMATAMLKGLKKSGVDGTAKHFCGNNQEYGRHFATATISERALREIYLKGFEMAVKSGYCKSIMTTYGAVNDVWTAGNYDLNTTILRNEWGFDGIVMTDWWASINERGKEADKTNFAAMVRAQNDLYMVCPDGSRNASGDNTMEALLDGRLTRAELQRSAISIAVFAMNTPAMDRLIETDVKVEIINRPKEDSDVDMDDVEFIHVDGDITISLEDKDSKAGTSYILPFDVKTCGKYEVTLIGSSSLGELAQLPCTLFYSSFPLRSFTFHGTNGEEDSITRTVILKQRFATMRLYVARNGLKLREIQFKFISSEYDESEF